MLLELGWQLETVVEKLQQQNPKIAQRFRGKRKENLASGAVTPVGAPTCASG